MTDVLSRRDAIKSVGGIGLGAVFGARALNLFADQADAATVTTCLLTPEVTEGPYWVEENLTRRNITEGKAGLPLVIRFTVLNAKTCKPIKNADVEIWHCDALGNYSAVNGATTRYLRGHQRANAAGRAEFLTIFPGWYRGRTPHIHMKVGVGSNTIHTGQVFFNEKITTSVCTDTHRTQPTANPPLRFPRQHLQASRWIDSRTQAGQAHRRTQGLYRHDRDRCSHLTATLRPTARLPRVCT